MKIGIVSAMVEEAALLKEEMQNVVCDVFGSREYYSGTLHGIETTLVFSRWGKVAAAIAATVLITRHKVDKLIFFGIAGAISEKLNIGDVVIGDKLFQHDMDARPLFQQYEIPLTNKIFFEPHEELLSIAESAVSDFLSNDIKTIIPETVLNAFSIKNPSSYSGAIASGDLFVGNLSQKQEIKKNMLDVLAVEMEGAAVAQVCSEHNIPFCVIRAISDKADHNAIFDFPGFNLTVIRFYSSHIIKNMYKNLTKGIKS